MPSGKLSLAQVGDDRAWDALVQRSPQGTLFSESGYLAAAGISHRRYFVMQGAQAKAGLALVVSADGRSCELDDLVIYGGLLFDLDESRQLAKRRHDEFQIAEFVAAHLASAFERVELQLAPQFTDVRPFLWHCYHEPADRRFAVDVRYTSYLSISSLRDFAGREEASPCFAAMETVRRYSVREARKKGGRVERARDAGTLLGFYGRLMAGQGECQPQSKLDGMRRVIDDLVERGRCALYHATDASGDVLYSVCYGWDAKRAYYLFGAGHPEKDEPWQGTLAHWEAFKDLAQRVDIAEVDLEGVNSPQRGWFKLGFGGDLRPYFRISKGGEK